MQEWLGWSLANPIFFRLARVGEKARNKHMAALPLFNHQLGKWISHFLHHQQEQDPSTDPVLGRLQWLGADWWSGKARPEALHDLLPGGLLHLLVRAPASGPTPRQRTHFQHVVENYARLWPVMTQELLRVQPLLTLEGTLLDNVDSATLCLPPLDWQHSPRWAMDFAFLLPDDARGPQGCTLHFYEWDLVEVAPGAVLEAPVRR